MASKEYKQRAKLASKLKEELREAGPETSLHQHHQAMALGVIKKSGRQAITHVVSLESDPETPQSWLIVVPVERGKSKHPELSDDELILDVAGWDAHPGTLYSFNREVLGDYEGPTDAQALETLKEAKAAKPLPLDGRVVELLMEVVN